MDPPLDRSSKSSSNGERSDPGACRPCAVSGMLIATTAVEHTLSLFTHNRSDFERVRGLRVREIG